MKTYYKNDLKHAYLILEGGEEEKEDYQVVMLRENEIPGILKTEVRYVDNKSQYFYDISGKTSFKTLYEKVQLSYDDMKKLVSNLLQTIHSLQKYMLDESCILLEPEYIFCDRESYFFCYYPSYNLEVKEAFHKLTEFFVREVNYKDEEGVRFAYTLHKSTMEENYSIEQIMKGLESKEEVPQIVDYVECMEEQEIENNLIEEKNDMWEPIRRFIERSKLRLWGPGQEDL